jgi:ABC-type transporter Mla MlaB component
VREPDAATVDALSRLLLTARRLGRDVRVARASDELHELTNLMGLSDAIPFWSGSDVEARGQAE